MTQETIGLAFVARTTGADLRLTARLNGVLFFDQILTTDEIKVQHVFPEVEGERYLVEIEMSGKLPEHTIVDDNGNITQDSMVEIKDFSLDNIGLAHLFTNNSQYHHDFNGSQEQIVDKFFGDMGCNGIVKFEFSVA